MSKNQWCRDETKVNGFVQEFHPFGDYGQLKLMANKHQRRQYKYSTLDKKKEEKKKKTEIPEYLPSNGQRKQNS